ncbi:E2/UBC family protein [Bradyrhizobium sp. LMG 9283]|uniref:E2/UBC family protein n=1 Tax=Bradyrhizobium sp. LMG 9283 TaxID=592064 RepID=UPI00388DD098
MENQNVNAGSEARDGARPEQTWKLNVQGVVIESRFPQIVVRDALKLAGFDPDAGWIIVLKIAGEPRKEVELNATIDLTHPGVEKLRLTPRHINNGEAAGPCRRDFALLPQDEVHLDRLGLRWETIADGARRWLLLHSYPLPQGYTVGATDIAIEVPVSYPGAQLDMFYCHPHLALANGQPIPQVQCIESVTGIGFQRWSRHRPWDSARDNVGTHLALVDESLRREVER